MDDIFNGNTFDDENELFYDDDYHSERDPAADEADNAAEELSDDEERQTQPLVAVLNTRFLKQGLEGENVAEIIWEVLDFMSSKHINLPLFLDALSCSDPGCHSVAKIQYAWTSLMVSDELPGILEWWYHPPRGSRKGKGKRPAGAQQVLRNFARKCVVDCVDREIKTSAPLFLSPPEHLSRETLISIDFQSLKEEVKAATPTLWEVLHQAAYSPEQEQRNSHKDPDMASPFFRTLEYHS